ncbi:hypothetical protein BJD62_gp19 [Gordonia phage Lucky10]|uniref:Uncharacterized protein n=1 Tax=Gordonia phage Lucky10 TaxID=1821557 RepID=A0A142KAX9_9CAUD|nr:hypothetical protein BJD62_gp19 [Gordonia phage Lucky10]AMS03262.1 hypothetical protein SEA_LUCKY10_19 [Gordonia phage Lucky10]
MTETEPQPKSERDLRVEKLSAALLHALLFANEQPYPLSVPAAVKVAEMLDDLGVRQTDEMAAEVELPGWVMQRLREEAPEVPVDADPFEPQETERVAEAPKRPSRIAKSKMGVVVQ